MRGAWHAACENGRTDDQPTAKQLTERAYARFGVPHLLATGVGRCVDR
jgi:hypothetical protein